MVEKLTKINLLVAGRALGHLDADVVLFSRSDDGEAAGSIPGTEAPALSVTCRASLCTAAALLRPVFITARK